MFVFWVEPPVGGRLAAIASADVVYFVLILSDPPAALARLPIA